MVVTPYGWCHGDTGIPIALITVTPADLRSPITVMQILRPILFFSTFLRRLWVFISSFFGHFFLRLLILSRLFSRLLSRFFFSQLFSRLFSVVLTSCQNSMEIFLPSLSYCQDSFSISCFVYHIVVAIKEASGCFSVFF